LSTAGAACGGAGAAARCCDFRLARRERLPALLPRRRTDPAVTTVLHWSVGLLVPFPSCCIALPLPRPNGPPLGPTS
jgi:hypothetical protein